jgi:N-acetyl-anhydromuramyl-L-alanine amidase AmpD
MKPIIYNKYRSTAGFNSRIRFIVLHYTASDFERSIETLTGPSVSAHYLIPDVTDPKYLKAGYKEQEVFNLVAESDRAWHAGESQWGSRQGLNDASIGVEIVNLATEKDGEFVFPPYHPEQIIAIEQLAKNILTRYPDIHPTHVLGHSDISIGRKSDPGPEFPWHALFLKGVGAWFDDSTRNKYLKQYQTIGLPAKCELVRLFKAYGYDTSNTSSRAGFKSLVRAFQLHFRPDNYNGVMDAQTAANLAALVDKYFPGA